MSQEYDYQVTAQPNGEKPISYPSSDPKQAGRIYREWRKGLGSAGGGTVELKRREIGPWKVVESDKVSSS
jgi:hypothetical protein